MHVTERSGHVCGRSQTERNSCANRWKAKIPLSSFLPSRFPFIIKLLPFILTYCKINYIPLSVHPVGLFHFSALLNILNVLPLFTWSTHYNFSFNHVNTLTTPVSPGLYVLFLVLFLWFGVLMGVRCSRNFELIYCLRSQDWAWQVTSKKQAAHILQFQPGHTTSLLTR
jgi:hypothetical protein